MAGSRCADEGGSPGMTNEGSTQVPAASRSAGVIPAELI